MTSLWFAILPSLLSAERPPRSLLPLSSRLEPDHASELRDVVEAQLSAGVHRVRYNHRRTEELSTANTAPIRIVVDYSSLYEETAPLYSACFAVGAWFARGLPDGGGSPPADGVATCVRGESEWGSSDCWGRCTADDLITAEGRDIVIGIVDQVVAEVSAFFSVQPVDGPLTFSVSAGRYQRALLAKGYTPAASCAADCMLLNGVAVADSYCTAGVTADAVLSITKPPTIAGVGGTGTYCASDTRGRPTWLVFAWIQSWATLTGSWSDHIDGYRGLVIHEIIHALGFSHSAFNLARSAAGERKGLLSLLPVDDSGADADEVWHFTKGRAYEVAQDYFGCAAAESASWQGLPLMGVPEVGRASHWETRIMRDDVMSYGHSSTVSAITLAAMEDLGYYLGNYSAAQCMAWGRSQGCNYVLTRCGAQIDDRSAMPSSAAECEGDPRWGAIPDELLAAKCAGGATPCESTAASGYLVGDDGVALCNNQCYAGARDDCAAAPTSALEGAGESEFMGMTVSRHWLQYLWLGVIGLSGLMAVGVCRTMFCPKEGSTYIMGFVSLLMLLVGAGLSGLFLIAALAIEVHSTVDLWAVEIDTFLDAAAVYVLLGLGGTLMVVGFATLCGMCCRSRCLLLTMFVFWVLLLLAIFGTSGFLAYWISTLDDVTSDQLATLQGESDGMHDGKLGATALAEVEGFVCRTYQLCCRDPALGQPAVPEAGSGAATTLALANRTCLQQHEGTSSDIAITMEDPSQENFCAYLTGSYMLSATPPDTICKLIDLIAPQETCQANFCLLGSEGYFDFVLEVVAFLRQYATWIGAALSVTVLFMMVLVVNLYNLSRRIKKSTRKVGVDSVELNGVPSY